MHLLHHNKTALHHNNSYVPWDTDGSIGVADPRANSLGYQSRNLLETSYTKLKALANAHDPVSPLGLQLIRQNIYNGGRMPSP